MKRSLIITLALASVVALSSIGFTIAGAAVKPKADTESVFKTDFKFIEVAVGSSGDLALAEDGTLWMWGYRWYGSAGMDIVSDDEFTVQYPVPTKITGVNSENESITAKFEHISLSSAGIMGTGHYLALDNEGYLWTWGENYHGQLGKGNSNTGYLYPENYEPAILPGRTYKAISAGDGHSMAIDSEGYLWTWGNNSDGALGFGIDSEANISVPTQFRI